MVETPSFLVLYGGLLVALVLLYWLLGIVWFSALEVAAEMELWASGMRRMDDPPGTPGWYECEFHDGDWDDMYWTGEHWWVWHEEGQLGAEDLASLRGWRELMGQPGGAS